VKVPELSLRAFEVNVKGRNWQSTVHALTAGKAKYEYLIGVRESWPDVNFTDLTCHSIGGPRDTAAFRRVAEYRGLPFAHIGMKVECDGRRGVILGHTDSANFEVLFDDGARLCCHPRWMMRYFADDGALILDTGGAR
jgi:hypothetical protein